MNQHEYLTTDEVYEIQQRISDMYQEEYLTAREYAELFNQLADIYIHKLDDTLFISNI
ncbi:hypothetical protein WL544_12010 [Staphylococcus epidermidis]|uniref:hypothetical protein n=1 Tax=Bacillales TaxID=1385 RepID=UPI000A8F1576|nr:MULTISPECIES: hypothetical protein [Bacillales]HAR0522049.1 hypothetical protein [Enterococcus faecium]MCG2105275.1 hypothetical protein [Staphylococcus epidermidis]MCG2123576.1 hypothetical protein [Staphylococcus epidermidis]MCG7828930.1 hypothetical protein [Staphylococcus epidermidis]MCM3102456.1 hypothetical protein [Staphylococcus epidermidis]